MQRRSIKDLKIKADSVNNLMKNNKRVLINSNASGYNVGIQTAGETGVSLMYCGSLGECIAFLDGVVYALRNL